MTTSATITATASHDCTTRVYNGSANVRQIVLSLASVQAGTQVLFTVYDNNVDTSPTAASGKTWVAGRSPAYTGRGPGTAGFAPVDQQSARIGNQQGQTAPNGAGVSQYWPVSVAGVIDFAGAPTVKSATTVTSIAAGAAGAYARVDMSTTASISAITAIPDSKVLLSITLIAGQVYTYTPLTNVAVSYGVNVVAVAVDTGATSLAGTVTLVYDRLP